MPKILTPATILNFPWNVPAGPRAIHTCWPYIYLHVPNKKSTIHVGKHTVRPMHPDDPVGICVLYLSQQGLFYLPYEALKRRGFRVNPKISALALSVLFIYISMFNSKCLLSQSCCSEVWWRKQVTNGLHNNWVVISWSSCVVGGETENPLSSPSFSISVWCFQMTFLIFHPECLGKWSNLTSIVFKGVGSTTNQIITSIYIPLFTWLHVS